MGRERVLIVVLIVVALGVGYFLGGGSSSALDLGLSPPTQGHAAGDIDWSGFVFPAAIKNQLKGDTGAAGAAGSDGAAGSSGGGGGGFGSCREIASSSGLSRMVVTVPSVCNGAPCFLYTTSSALSGGVEFASFYIQVGSSWVASDVSGTNGNTIQVGSNPPRGVIEPIFGAPYGPSGVDGLLDDYGTFDTSSGSWMFGSLSGTRKLFVCG